MAPSAVILVGHGAPALDTPPYLVFKLKQLAARRRALGGPPSLEEVDVEEKIRSWPRTTDNDPYRRGLEALANRVRSRLAAGVELTVAYLEFCSPSVVEALERAGQNGTKRLVVVPSMMTPGGSHAEVEIPELIDQARTRFSGLEIVYAWPFELDDVADLFARHLFAQGTPAAHSR